MKENIIIPGPLVDLRLIIKILNSIGGMRLKDIFTEKIPGNEFAHLLIIVGKNNGSIRCQIIESRNRSSFDHTSITPYNFFARIIRVYNSKKFANKEIYDTLGSKTTEELGLDFICEYLGDLNVTKFFPKELPNENWQWRLFMKSWVESVLYEGIPGILEN